MWRPVTAGEEIALREFLSAHLDSSMFLPGNLEEHGLAGEAAHACRYWCLGSVHSGVFARSLGGMVMMQAPQADAAAWREAARLLIGQDVAGIVGEAVQVFAFTAAADWPGSLNMDSVEPGYSLDLDALVMPPLPAEFELCPLAALDRMTAEIWREGYVIETGMAAPHRARGQAVKEIAHYLERGMHRMLMRDGLPVAMTGFNSIAGDAVQVGGVWTPPELRGREYARCAVALHLAEARARGARRGFLFAASAMAARAYKAIGFQRAFDFGWRLYSDPIEVPA